MYTYNTITQKKYAMEGNNVKSIYKIVRLLELLWTTLFGELVGTSEYGGHLKNSRQTQPWGLNLTISCVMNKLQEIVWHIEMYMFHLCDNSTFDV